MEDLADQSIDEVTPGSGDDPQPSMQVSGQTADDDYNGLDNELDDANNSVFVEQNADEESECNNDVGTTSVVGPNLEIPKQVEQEVSPAVKKEAITTAPVTDLSDPLHSYQMLNDETIFDYSSAPPLREDKRNTNRQFKKALGEVTLTISPYVKVDLPYLETEAGSKCKLRSCFPSEIFWSQVFHPKAKDAGQWRKLSEVESVATTTNGYLDVLFLPPHPFVLDKLSSPVSDSRIQVNG